MASEKESRYPLYLGLIPDLLFVALIVILQLVFHGHPPTRKVFGHPMLLPVLHILFLCLTSFVVACVSAYSYVQSGPSGSTLLLGCGILTLSTGAFFTGWLIGPGGQSFLIQGSNG